MSGKLQKLVMVEIPLHVTTDIGSIIHAVSDEQPYQKALDLIQALDLAQEDAGFTLDAISMLILSLVDDMSVKDIKHALKKVWKHAKVVQQHGHEAAGVLNGQAAEVIPHG